MSVLSEALKKFAPGVVDNLLVTSLVQAFVAPLIPTAKSKGRDAVVRALTLKESDLTKLNPKVDKAKLTEARRTFAEAGASIVLLVAGAEGN